MSCDLYQERQNSFPLSSISCRFHGMRHSFSEIKKTLKKKSMRFCGRFMDNCGDIWGDWGRDYSSKTNLSLLN